MTLKYVGSRAFRHRLAEFSYDDHEEDRFDKIVEALRAEGYEVDNGVENWAAIRVCDREEFDEVKELFQQLKKDIK